MRLNHKLLLLASLILPLAGLLSLPLLFPFPWERLERRGASTAVYDREGNLLRLTRGDGDEVSLPVPLSAMGDWAGKAVIAAEDKRFFRHPGIDPIAVGRAIAQNLASGRIVSGASTLSTLTVKLIHPSSPRNLGVKLREAVQALLLERVAPKERILEEYLNRAPFGGNLVGIEAASLLYFGKSARDLSLPEAALLAGIPKAPGRLRPDRDPKAAERRRDLVLRRMAEAGMLPEGESVGGASSPDPCRPGSRRGRRSHTDEKIHFSDTRRRDLPFLAPHYCDLVLALFPGEKKIATPLEPRLQSILESVLSAQFERLRPEGIRSGAGVIIHVPTGEVRALVGSPDYRESESGQVNCATAPRSPGSALKPFIYALAFERGLAAPSAVVADIPISLGSWRPENYSRTFEGLVSVRDALVRSLNVPAVRFVRELTPEAVLSVLKSLGLSTLDRSAREYGLGIAVGTCEVTLLDLTAACACLAREGLFLPPRLETRTPPPAPRRIFSAAAAYLVAEILSGDERALLVSGHAADTRLPRFAFKTGTSNGLKDAWAIAWNPDYAVGIWFGNPDGRPSPALVGGEAAAPAAGEIFRRLYPGGDGPWYRKPESVVERKVCARSGQTAGPDCPFRATDLAIAGVSPSYPCRIHRPGESGESWPDEIASYLEKSGLAQAGAHGAPGGRRRVAIASPAKDQTFALLPNLPAIPQGISLSASAPGAERVFWFVDGVFFAESLPGEGGFWPLQRGDHVILCCDDAGNADGVRVRVE